MKTPEQCKDELLDGRFPMLDSLTDFIDVDQSESMLRAIYNAVNTQSDRDLLVFAKSLRKAIDESLTERADKLSELSKTPFDSDKVNKYD